MKRIGSVLVIIAWLGSMGLLIDRYYGGPADVEVIPPAGLPRALFEEEWMGIYKGGEKIGYSHRKLEEADGGYHLTEGLKIKAKVMGVMKEMDTRISASLDGALRLMDFDAELMSDVDITVRGTIEGRELILAIGGDGGTRMHTFRLDDVPSLASAVIPVTVKDGRGGAREMSIIDPSSLSVSKMKIEVVGSEPIMSMGRMITAIKMEGSLQGVPLRYWVTEEGSVVRMESPMGLTLVRERKADAVKPGTPSLDLISQSSVPFTMSLPEDTEYLKVRIRGIDPRHFDLDGGRQRLTGDVLEIYKEEIDTVQRGEGLPERDGYLAETALVQAKAPAIRSLAGSIVGDEGEAVNRARMITMWLYENIRKEPVISIPSALDVLRKKRGDCNEHTTLFAAVARAAGIPTRMASGLVYSEGAFYYHAWPEVHIGRWVAVDPTLGQFPADAAHIRLLTGDLAEQMGIAAAIGRISLEGIACR